MLKEYIGAVKGLPKDNGELITEFLDLENKYTTGGITATSFKESVTVLLGKVSEIPDAKLRPMVKKFLEDAIAGVVE